jgi:peptidoglycan-N-acetylglucosamine deacetylase
MYFFKTPSLFKYLFKDFVWEIKTNDKEVYLTFDDGPTHDLTNWILKILEEYDAKGTFFCVGENVKKYPEQYQAILQAGHAVGNHTHQHLNGWKTGTNRYITNVEEASKYIDSNLFRPPYGRLKPSQSQYLKKLYKIIQWDVLSGDFDKAMTPETCMKQLRKNVKPGSIIVFHDSVKAERIVRYVLPLMLMEWYAEGYTFKSLAHLVSKTEVSPQQ